MACAVLEKLSKASPQAQRYHEILLQFLDAVESYQNTISQRQPTGESEYLERILRPRPDRTLRQSGHTTTASSPPELPSSDEPMQDSVATSSFEAFLWNQPNTLTPQVSDEVGFQILWEELTPQLSVQVQDDVAQFQGEPFDNFHGTTGVHNWLEAPRFHLDNSILLDEQRPRLQRNFDFHS